MEKELADKLHCRNKNREIANSNSSLNISLELKLMIISTLNSHYYLLPITYYLLPNLLPLT